MGFGVGFDVGVGLGVGVPPLGVGTGVGFVNEPLPTPLLNPPVRGMVGAVPPPLPQPVRRNVLLGTTADRVITAARKRGFGLGKKRIDKTFPISGFKIVN